MTQTGAPSNTLPAGPHPIALLLAYGLVSRQRLRLTDSRDSRLGELAGQYELGMASWTGSRAAFVGFYRPPGDPTEAGADLSARCQAAQRWGEERLHVQSAQQCDILIIALGPVVGDIVAPATESPVRLGVISVDPATAQTRNLLPSPTGLPSARDVQTVARAVLNGQPVPTLAAVDLAERQAVAGAYATPAVSALAQHPVMTYTLIGVFIAIWLLEKALLQTQVLSDGSVIYTHVTISDMGVFDASHGGDWWRYVSATFLHDPDSILHVGLNSFSMFIIGRFVEQLYGRMVLLGTFLFTGVTGCLAVLIAYQTHLLQDPQVLGASAGICGLIGLLLVMGIREGKNVPTGLSQAVRRNSAINIVFILVYSFAIPNVSAAGHIGGFVGGALIGLVLPPLQRVGGRSLRSYEVGLIGLVVVISVIALGVAGVSIVNALNRPAFT